MGTGKYNLYRGMLDSFRESATNVLTAIQEVEKDIINNTLASQEKTALLAKIDSCRVCAASVRTSALTFGQRQFGRDAENQASK